MSGPAAPDGGGAIDAATLFDLTGKTALVTGGSRGIGRMIAEGFLQAGATVYVSSRKADACAQTAAELSAAARATPCPRTSPTTRTAGGWCARSASGPPGSTSW